MENWLHAINIARNVCAHHSRLWNKPSVVQPKRPLKADCPELAHISGNTHSQTRVYGMAVLCAFLLKTINPSSRWPQRFKDLVGNFPNSKIGFLVSSRFSGRLAEGSHLELALYCERRDLADRVVPR
jgi:abortive infection bacteriophage resistance protein